MTPDPIRWLLPHIQGLKTYEGIDPTEVLAQQAGIPPDKVIRLNGNENPYGSSPRVAEVLGGYCHFNRYPDPDQRRLRAALAEYVGVEAEQVVAGNGSDELIDLVLRMFVGPGQKVIDPTPTFGMYSFCTTVCGGQTVPVPRDDSFDLDIESIELTADSQTKVIFLASPNNPTGNLAHEWQVRRLLETDMMVVVDETYHEFCGQSVVSLLEEYPNLIVLRTFSKWAGLAGLRIGLGAMNREVAQAMMAMKSPYNVNLAAEVALLASLEDRDVLIQRVTSIVKERDRMYGMLEALPGVEPWPSTANFVLCQLPDGKGKVIYEGLARRGVFVRYFGGDRMADYVRISVGLPNETDGLIEALRAEMEGVAL